MALLFIKSSKSFKDSFIEVKPMSPTTKVLTASKAIPARSLGQCRTQKYPF